MISSAEEKTKERQDVFQLGHSYSRLPSLQSGKIRMTNWCDSKFPYHDFSTLAYRIKRKGWGEGGVAFLSDMKFYR